MNKRIMNRRPTRRDLLVVVGRLQTLISRLESAANDRNPNRAAWIAGIAREWFNLCVAARSYDTPVDGGPWSVEPPQRKYV